MIRAELPKLSHVDNIGDRAFFVTNEARVGVAYAVTPVDAELRSVAHGTEAVRRLISSVPQGATLRFIADTFVVTPEYPTTARAASLSRMGAIQHETTITIEKAATSLSILTAIKGLSSATTGGSFLAAEASSLHTVFDATETKFWNAKPLGKEDLSAMFRPFAHQAIRTVAGIDSGLGHLGVVRLTKQSPNEIDETTLTSLRVALPAPYRIVTTLKRLSKSRAQLLLNRRQAQLATSNKTTTNQQYLATTEILDETYLAGADLVELEWLLILERPTERELYEAIAVATKALSPLGETYHETWGAFSSFAASLPGGRQHHTFLESDRLAPLYVPMYIKGEPLPDRRAVPTRAMLLHRADDSLHAIDQFSKNYLCFNVIIIGKSGSGKSVAANILTRSLLADPNVDMTKIDVCGSYRKECELYRGRQIDFTLNEPTGLNPFEILKTTKSDNDVTSILSEFVASLILEEDETHISRAHLSAVESAVKAYVDASHSAPSFSDFLNCSPELPRRALLGRWADGGVFENIFKARPGTGDTYRYTYFNFDNIMAAGRADFAQGCMAAAIAVCDMEVVRLGDARKGSGKRHVLFIDEAPFFIHRNGRNIRQSAANRRKLGHGLGVVSQATSDLIFTGENGQPDAGILNFSTLRFFFNDEESPKEYPTQFRDRFGLTDMNLQQLASLQRSREYRECLFQDEELDRGRAACILRLRLTPEEYWETTSSDPDNQKLYALRRAIPELTLEEAIRCLAYVSH